MEFSDKEGEMAVKIARDSVESFLNDKELDLKKYEIPDKFQTNYGVFTTINSYPGLELRGCIGFPEPIYSLIKALAESAIYAATEDPRFKPVKKDEVDKIVFEVSLLTPPKKMLVNKPSEYLEYVQIGKDGLIAEYNGFKGLLLPQVAVDYNMGVEEFLQDTCMKAGLNSDCWKNPAITFYNFSAEIFEETAPYSKIIRKQL